MSFPGSSNERKRILVFLFLQFIPEEKIREELFFLLRAIVLTRVGNTSLLRIMQSHAMCIDTIDVVSITLTWQRSWDSQARSAKPKAIKRPM